MTLSLLHRLVTDIFEDGRADPAPPPEPPPDLPPPEPQPNNAAAVLLNKDLVAGAKKHGWRCQWQREAIALGARSDDLAYDLKKGHLQIFSDSLRVDPRGTALFGVYADDLFSRWRALRGFRNTLKRRPRVETVASMNSNSN